MKNEFNIEHLTRLFIDGNIELSTTIKTLLYHMNPNIFDILNFEDDNIYQEPLLYSYFNLDDEERKKYDINQVLWGYTAKDLLPKETKVLSNKNGIIYIANWGWLHTSFPNAYFILNNEGILLSIENKEIVDFKFEEILIHKTTGFEILKYHIPLLGACFYDTEKNRLDVEVQKITLKHHETISTVLSLIKELLPEYFELIKKGSRRVQIFNIETHLSNSFATIAAQGIAFLNAYQEDYNEVFFLDDFMHQSGHVLFNNIIYDKKKFFKVEPNTMVKQVKSDSGELYETRDIEVLIHALYTYYTTFIVLDVCLENKIFDGNKELELLSRMECYIRKCYSDLSLLEHPSFEVNQTDVLYQIDDLLTSEGMILYTGLKNKFNEMYKKWHHKTKHYDLDNQPYNFTFSNFLKSNSLKV